MKLPEGKGELSQKGDGNHGALIGLEVRPSCGGGIVAVFQSNVNGDMRETMKVTCSTPAESSNFTMVCLISQWSHMITRAVMSAIRGS